MKIPSEYRNWRVWLVSFLFLTAIILCAGETDDFMVFITTKIIGLVIMLLVVILANYWQNTGKIKFDDENGNKDFRSIGEHKNIAHNLNEKCV